MSIHDPDSAERPTPTGARSLRRFLAELKRRHVFRAAAVYGAVGFTAIEVTEAIFPHLGIPDRAITLVVWLVLFGFPLALVLAWAYESAPEGGIRRTPEVDPADLDAIVALPASRRWPIGLAGAAGGALLVAGAWLALDVSRAPADDVALSILRPGPDAKPGVAVLPFRTNGEEIAYLGEGMVDLLSANLDGIPGLRKIDPATVMAVSNRLRDDEPDRARGAGLDVTLAARTGAAYAIGGSATRVGPSTVNLVAQVYDVSTGRTRGPSVEATGPVDRPDRLADELTVALVRQGGLPVDGDVPLTNLASAMTDSPEALHHYLEGEAHYRRGQYGEAIASYQRALEFDADFGRVFYRLGSALGWEGEFGLAAEYEERARAAAGRLPRRDSLLASAPSLFTSLDRVAYFERFTAEFPDDADGWTQLGESILHRHGGSFLPTSRFVEVFDHAVQLAPHYDETYSHLFEDAFARLDSARVYALLDRYEAANPEGRGAPYRILADRRWGDYAQREKAMAAMDAIEGELPDFVWITSAVSERWTEREERESLPVIREARSWEASMELWRVLQRRAFRGEPDALEPTFRAAFANDSLRAVAAGHVVALHLAGLTDSTGLGRAREILAEVPMVSTGYLLNHFWLGALAVAEEDWAEAARQASRADSVADAMERYGSDLVAKRAVEKRYAIYGVALREFLQVMRGDDAHLPTFEDALAGVPLSSFQSEFPIYHMKYEVGKLLLEQGDLARAERYFRSLDPYATLHYVPAQYQLGRVYEAMGEPAKAREHYLIVWNWWRDADPYLQPWRNDVEEALRRLSPDA